MILYIIGILILLFLGKIYTSTGFLKQNDLDKKDSEVWEFKDEIIVGAEAFTIEGTSGTCWALYHGYTSTPPVYKELAIAINNEFNDTVIVPRLKGHGMLPSNLLKHNIDEWYKEMEDIDCQYIVGSSTFAGLTLKYAAEHDPEAIILLGTYIKAPHILGSPFFIKIAHSLGSYSYKNTVGTIDDPEGQKVHIATWGFPLKSVVDYHENYLPNILANTKNIKAKTLMIHATHDTVASLKEAKALYNTIPSEKQFIETKGNHLILRDYDKEKAIEAILSFRES